MNELPPAKRTAVGLVIFGFGFFPLLAQALLFRAFLNAFEGHEFAVGCFFASWLLWLGAGAAVGRLWMSRRGRMPGPFDLWPLLYLPAFLLQVALLTHARHLAGVQSYELFPLLQGMAVALAANAPVSLATGFLFTLACGWATRASRVPLAYVYALESLGSFAGGLAVTLLLVAGWNEEASFLAGAFVLLAITAVSAASRGARRPAVAAACLAAACLAALASGLDQRWAAHRHQRWWQRLLPGATYAGSFSTPQARYLYGLYRGQFNVASGETVCETVPEREHASELVALHLAQAPHARRVLIIGSGGYALCQRWLGLPQLESVTWLHPDPDYPAALLRALPSTLATDDPRLRVISREIRSFLRDAPDRYDLALLMLPDVTSLLLNRYATLDFCALLRSRLAPGGVLGVRISGADNFLGGDLAQLGASAYLGLQRLFRHTALKPGDESWILASDADTLTGDARVLEARWRSVAGYASIYPAEGLATLYPADRITFQRTRYEQSIASAPPLLLLNTDQHPRGMLFGLLVAARQGGFGEGIGIFLRAFAQVGPYILLAGFVLWFLLRGVYVGTSPFASGPARSARPFDNQVLVFSSGFAGMGLSVILMFQYQVRFASLALHVGLLSALFMLGLYLGSRLLEDLLHRQPARVSQALAGLLSVHLLILAGLGWLPDRIAPAWFHALFVLGGLLTGSYVPIAALRMAATGPDAEYRRGMTFLLLDNAGGAAGGFLVTLLLVPTLGADAALGALSLLVALNIWALLPGPDRQIEATTGRTGRPDLLRSAAYGMFGLAAFVLIAAQLVRHTDTGRAKPDLPAVARSMLEEPTARLEALTRLDNGDLPGYAARNEQGHTHAFVFSTGPFVSGPRGYGGRLVLAAAIDPDGTLRNLRILEAQETPAYLARVKTWLQELRGINLFTDSMTGIDGLSGATISSEAVLRTLQQAGPAFADYLQGKAAGTTGASGFRVERGALYILWLLLVVLAVRRHPQPWLRRCLLLVTLVVCGLHLNAQYSLDQVFALLALRWPEAGLHLPFLMVLMVPLLVLTLGNIYCGYLCPFGALQELLGDLCPTAWRQDPDRGAWRLARFVKYVLLFLAVLWFALCGQRAAGAADPLVTAFSPERLLHPGRLVLLVLALALVYRRFWCRNLCPAGAFLSLLNRARLLRRLVPATQPAHCDMGVCHLRDLDCLHCDRCRRSPPVYHAAQAGSAHRRPDACFLALVAVAALLLLQAGLTVHRELTLREAGRAAPAAVPGAARTANIRAIKDRIDQHQLSRQRALFYREYTEPAGD